MSPKCQKQTSPCPFPLWWGGGAGGLCCRPQSLLSSFAAETDLAVGSGGPNASPEAKENDRSDRERDHDCVP